MFKRKKKPILHMPIPKQKPYYFVGSVCTVSSYVLAYLVAEWVHSLSVVAQSSEVLSNVLIVYKNYLLKWAEYKCAILICLVSYYILVSLLYRLFRNFFNKVSATKRGLKHKQKIKPLAYLLILFPNVAKAWGKVRDRGLWFYNHFFSTVRMWKRD